jgi:phosphoribosylaminoimidazolecarboxamide formyltransferase/IMP cyclohydrolase
MNPCGVGSSTNIEDAFTKAKNSDPVSIFGGIVALNREVTSKLAEELNTIFLEIIIAPEYQKDALKILSKKKNLRVLKLDTTKINSDSYQF